MMGPMPRDTVGPCLQEIHKGSVSWGKQVNITN